VRRAAIQIGRRDLAVGAEVRQVDHGGVAHPLVDRHRGHVAPFDQVVERRVHVRVGVAADREHRALQRVTGGVRGHQLGGDLPAEVRADREAQVDDSHRGYRSATSTETGKP
jgi:hypothetical protein